MTQRLTLSGDYGSSQVRISDEDVDVIDASRARWTLSNMGDRINPYPLIVEEGRTGLEIIGGSVLGRVSLGLDWVDVYAGNGTPDDREGNSAAMELRSTVGATIRDWSISRVWDGLRVKDGARDFVIENVHVDIARDDAIENDQAASGTIRDCLFEGVFSGISLGDGDMDDASDEVVRIDGVLIRMESYLYEGEVTHQSPLKMEGESPSLRITDSVFAIEDVDHGGLRRLELAWDKLVGSSGNVFLNLSDEPLPDDYPRPGKGWTILEGQAARDYWRAARKDWMESRGDDGPRLGSRADDVLRGSDSDDEIRGLEGRDRLFGLGGDDILGGGGGADRLEGGRGDDRLAGSSGHDRIVGGGERDHLWGGEGDDVFRFHRASEGNDVIGDFQGGTGRDDRFVIGAAGFGGGLEAGRVLAEWQFQSWGDNRAQDGGDRFIFRTTDKTLWFDVDGRGGEGPVLLADLQAGAVVTAADILLV